MSVLNVVYRQLEVSATGRSLVQRSPIDCGASNERDLETSTVRRPVSIKALELLKKKYKANTSLAS
jgi:hypothetical protein